MTKPWMKPCRAMTIRRMASFASFSARCCNLRWVVATLFCALPYTAAGSTRRDAMPYATRRARWRAATYVALACRTAPRGLQRIDATGHSRKFQTPRLVGADRYSYFKPVQWKAAASRASGRGLIASPEDCRQRTGAGFLTPPRYVPNRGRRRELGPIPSKISKFLDRGVR